MDFHGKAEKVINARAAIEDKNKSAARKRLLALFDEGTFVEIGAFVKQRPTEFGAVDGAAEGVVTGYGAVNGVLVFAFSQDVSVIKGAVSEMNAKKICNIAEMAIKANAPLVSMLDSCGVRLHEGVDALAGYGDLISVLNKIAGQTVHVSAVFGTCAGAMSFVPATADYALMMKNAELFLSSPDVVKARYGEKSAGTAETAYKNGTVSAVCESEEEIIAKIKEFIAYTNDAYVTEDDINRQTPEIADIIENNGDVRDIIKSIADDGRMLELYGGYAENIITALINLDCSPVGVVANNGALNSDAAEKAAQFVSFCDDCGISVLTLANTDGFECESKQNIKNSSLLVSAYVNSDVPKVTLIIGKDYGAGYITMCSKQTGADIVYAYANAEIAALPAETGAVFMLGQEIASSKNKNPIEGRDEVINKYRETIASPFEAAKRGYIDDIIDVETTRQLLASSFGMLADK